MFSSLPDGAGRRGPGLGSDEEAKATARGLRASYGTSAASKGFDAPVVDGWQLLAAVHWLGHVFRSIAVWLVMTTRLILFAMLLLPAFLRVGLTHFRDPRILRGVRFGPGPRCFCDVYVPVEAKRAQEGKGAPVPVVVAVMGGAWVIGHRTWNAQLGQRLMDAGVLVIAIDYRNYPFAKVPDMVKDLDRGVSWAFASAASYGGDPGNVLLTGQSAGAHLSSLLLLRRGLEEFARECPSDIETGTPGTVAESTGTSSHLDDGGEPWRRPWSAGDLRGFVGVSGPYDLAALGSHLESRGLSSALLRLMCPGSEIERYSPVAILQDPQWKAGAAKLLPRMLLFHGAADKTVPAASSEAFAEALQDAGAPEAVADVRPGLAHAEVIIEGPMRGEDHQVQLLLPFLLGEVGCKDRLASMPPLRPMYPHRIIAVASRLMPF